MKASKGIYNYLIGAWLQIGIVCLGIMLLRKNGINYPNGLQLIFLGVGGTSTALWGMIIVRKTGLTQSSWEVLKDYFNVKACDFFIFFGCSLIFGGIEEIGWRYTFGRLVRRYLSFELTALCCFGGWAIWHYLRSVIVCGYV